MISFLISPGEGLPLYFTFPEDVSGWGFAASAHDLRTGAKLTDGDLAVVAVDANTWEAKITGEQATAWKGSRFLVRAVGTNPGDPTMPTVDEVEVAVRPV